MTTDDPNDPLASRIRDAYERTPAPPPGSRERVLAVVRRRGRRAPWLDWLTTPVVVRFSPAAAIAACALIALASVALWRALPPAGRVATPGPDGAAVLASTAESALETEFVFVMPDARSVAVVGDFNEWSDSATVMRCAPDGVTWTARVRLAPGRHLYGFLVNGERWMTDPQAPLAPDPGFGGASSVVLVGKSVAS